MLLTCASLFCCACCADLRSPCCSLLGKLGRLPVLVPAMAIMYGCDRQLCDLPHGRAILSGAQHTVRSNLSPGVLFAAAALRN